VRDPVRRREDAEEAEARQQRERDDEKMKLCMMDERERTEEERVDAFVEEYVKKHHVTRGYRFVGAREGTLMAALIEVGLMIQLPDMKKRIHRHVAAAPDSEAASPPPAE
jgi:hypothetical protein